MRSSRTRRQECEALGRLDEAAGELDVVAIAIAAQVERPAAGPPLPIALVIVVLSAKRLQAYPRRALEVVAIDEALDVIGGSRRGGAPELMPHRHPEDRVYTVMSGVFYIGLGDQFDGDKVEAYPPGDQWCGAPRAPSC